MPRRPSPTGPRPSAAWNWCLRDSGAASPAGHRVVPGRNAHAGARHPVFAGWGGRRGQSSIQVENLASHGFVVVGCDDVASDPATDPDPASRSSSAPMSAEGDDRARRPARRPAGQPASSMSCARSKAGQAPALAGRLDLERASAPWAIRWAAPRRYRRVCMDHRISAVLNIDGALFGPPADQIGRPSLLPAVEPRGHSDGGRAGLSRSGRAELCLSQHDRHTAQQAAHGAARQLLGHDGARRPRRPLGLTCSPCAGASCFAPTSSVLP